MGGRAQATSWTFVLVFLRFVGERKGGRMYHEQRGLEVRTIVEVSLDSAVAPRLLVLARPRGRVQSLAEVRCGRYLDDDHTLPTISLLSRRLSYVLRLALNLSRTLDAQVR